MEKCFSATWPVKDAQYQGRIEVDNILEPDIGSSPSLSQLAGGGPDKRWMHLHREDPGLSNPRTLSITWLQGCAGNGGGLWNSGDGGSDLNQWEFRFVMGEGDAPISDWLSWSSVQLGVTVDMNGEIPGSGGVSFDSAFPMDGIFHVSFEMRPSGTPSNPITDYAPYPMYAHVRRNAFEVTTRTPIGIYEPDESGCRDCCSQFSPQIPYVDSADRVPIGFPANPQVEPFDADFYTARNSDALYVEKLGPHSPLFQPINMWWADPAADDLPFIRPFPPKFEESSSWTDVYDSSDGSYHPATIRLTARHERFPMKDGPRGVGWMSAYVQGQVDSQGRFAFVETGGRLAYLYPDGTIHTIAGWVTDPNKDPVWIYKSKDAVRKNQILRGTWISGQYDNGPNQPSGGFHLPMDVTYDPNNENELYVAGFEDHCIWKVTINHLSTEDCDGGEDDVTVEVFAGDVNHGNCILDPSECEVDGVGTDARFHSPISLVFDPVCNCIYVADHVSSRIRRIDPETRQVTTLFGASNLKYPGNRLYPYGPPGYIESLGVSPSGSGGGWDDQESTCLENNASGAPSIQTAGGSDPLIFMPQTIRVTSTGNLVVLEHGWGTIREIDPDTGDAVIRARVHPKGDDFSRGWMWMDVDRWGNSGGLDSIYWCKFVGEVYGDSHGAVRTGDPACRYPNDVGTLKEPTCPQSSTCNAQCDSNPRHRCPDGCASNMFSETYGWAPGGNDDTRSYLVFTHDWHQQFGLPMEVNPPHYPWLVAVDPRGAVLFAGAGVQGLIRMRMRREDDPVPFNESAPQGDKYYPFWNGRRIWEAGDPQGEYGGGPLSPSVGLHGVHGWYGHNLLGLGADAYMVPGLSDQEVLDLFQVPDSIRNDPTATQYVLYFLRNNAGTTASDAPIQQVDPNDHCPASSTSSSESTRVSPDRKSVV